MPPKNPDHLDVEDWDRVGYWIFWLTLFVAIATNGPFAFTLIVLGSAWWVFHKLTTMD